MNIRKLEYNSIVETKHCYILSIPIISFDQALDKLKKLNECYSVLTMNSNESDSEAEKEAATSIKQDQLREIASKKVHAYKNLSL